MADKLPYLQLYIADYIRDTRMLSLPTRAIWMDFLTLMHDSDRRGHLLSRTGTPFSPEQLAAYCATSREAVHQAIQELKTSGVASCTESGILYSRRMVKDERRRQAARAAGKKGGNPALKRGGGADPPPDGVNQGVKGEDKQNVILTSSKRGSEEGGAGGETAPAQAAPPARSKGRAVDALDPDFDKFWRAYPNQVKKLDACRAWDAINPGAELVATILRAVERQKRTKKWIDGMIPNPDGWLLGQRWEDVVEPIGVADAEDPEERRKRILRERRQEEEESRKTGDPSRLHKAPNRKPETKPHD